MPESNVDVSAHGADTASALEAAAPDRESRQRLVALPARVDHVVALAGNPNVGKSTVFNSLTGLRQHTGNWPGKTVARAEGTFAYAERTFRVVDLPGTYSLLATSVDEEIARDFVLFGRPDVTVIVVDATRLERNLSLALQVLEITDRAVLCLNLVDEARRRRISIDVERLGDELGVPVVATAARFDTGIDDLLATIDRVARTDQLSRPKRIVAEIPGLEDVVAKLQRRIDAAFPRLPNTAWIALRLLDGDPRLGEMIRRGELNDLARRDAIDIDGPTPHEAGKTSSHGSSSEVDEARPDDVSAPGTAILEEASRLRWEAGPGFHQRTVEAIYAEAARIADRCTVRDGEGSADRIDRRLDRIFTGRFTGTATMLAMLVVVLWLTIVGANYPSAMLASLLLDTVHPALKSAASSVGMAWWLDGLLIDGVYLATAWVVSVMLPPMAIFFPLFTLLEDFGYLPRVAFNLDRVFRRCGGHGKQALTMCMGLGCNAAGVIAARVIDSPRERLLAIITNNFALCNGRWPTQILIASVFLGALVPGYLAGFVSALAVVAVALLGIAVTLLTSWLLSKTMLRGEPSTFHLELPPYRPPRILQTLYTSLIDRTLFVLWRAVVFAVPAGAMIWLVANIPVGQETLADWLIARLDPVGVALGLNGIILLAYVVAIPANEIVIPTVLMLTVLTTGIGGVGEPGAGVMFELDSESATRGILDAGGWTILTAVNLMLFSLLHNPCSTTIYTIWKETRSKRWTLLATFLPLMMGLVTCAIVARVWSAFVTRLYSK